MSSIIINNLSVIFAMIIFGFAAGRARIFSDRAKDDFTAFLMQVTLPCLIVTSMIRDYDSTLIRDSIIIFILGLIIFGGLNLINVKTAVLLRITPERRSIWGISTSLCNTGFMGFPMLLAVFGSPGLFLGSIMNIGYNIITWTLCVALVAGDSGDKAKINWKKVLCTNANYAVVIGMFFFLTQIKLPDPAMTVLNGFGNITTPLSMFLIGLSLADGRITQIFRDRDIILCTIIRLAVVPVLIALFMRALPLPDDSILPGVVTLILAMPCPSAGIMLAQMYKKDVTMAAGAVFLSSLCCIITIPLVMMLL